MRKRTLLIFAGSILIMILVLIVVISPLIKYALEKYDKPYTGREITVDWVYANPFTGYIHLSGLKIFESASDSVFLSASGLSVNVALLKLLIKTYELSEVTFDRPRGVIIQNQKKLNFSDLIDLFSPLDSATTRKPVHFNIGHTKIINGEFHYLEKLIPVNYFIKNVNIESDGKQWNIDTIASTFNFISGIGGGSLKGDFTINTKNNDYRFSVVAKKFDLKFIQQYIKDMANYANFSALLDANIQATGNLNDQEDIIAKGQLAFNDFHFGKDSTEDYASFKSLRLGIINLSPKNRLYLFDSISLQHPYVKYERYDHLDNYQNMFGGGGVKINAAVADSYKFNLVIEVARYIKVLSKNFFKSNYQVNNLVVHEGDLVINDYSLTEQFSLNLKPIHISADSIDRSHNRVGVSLQSSIKPYGNISITLSLNPKDTGEYDMHYKLEKLPASLFNPYIISYTSFALNRGTIECKGTWNVRKGIIDSNNHLMIIDPRVTARVENDDTEWIPLPFIMALVRERGNMIDYDIPISGNLKDPKFHIGNAILDLLKNIFVKPPTTPYGIQVKSTEEELEKSLTLSWPMRATVLEQDQERFVMRMANFLTRNPEATIDVYPLHYEAKEKEHILFFEAKKKYFLLIHSKTEKTFSKSDEEAVDLMSVKDKAFIKYLNQQVADSMVFTIQEKCNRIIDSKVIQAKFEQLRKERQVYFINYFENKEVASKIIIHPSQNIIPYNGFSYYKIDYKNELPNWLVKAYKEMNKLNNEPLRRKLRRERLESKAKL